MSHCLRVQPRRVNRALPPRPVTILIAALGGEGGGVLADWLVHAATVCDYPVQSTSIPGVSQRTGATTYYVEIYPAPAAQLGGRIPVMALIPSNISVQWAFPINFSRAWPPA